MMAMLVMVMMTSLHLPGFHVIATKSPVFEQRILVSQLTSHRGETSRVDLSWLSQWLGRPSLAPLGRTPSTATQAW